MFSMFNAFAEEASITGRISLEKYCLFNIPKHMFN